MTIELVLIALAVGTVSACLLFLGLQLWETRHREQVADYDAMLKRIEELVEHHSGNEPLAETARRVAAQRKDAQRRARQRKARKRQ